MFAVLALSKILSVSADLEERSSVDTPFDRNHGVDCEAAVLLHRSIRDPDGPTIRRVFRPQLNMDQRELNVNAIRTAFEFDGSMDIDGMLQLNNGIDRLVFYLDALNAANAIFLAEGGYQQHVGAGKYLREPEGAGGV